MKKGRLTRYRIAILSSLKEDKPALFIYAILRIIILFITFHGLFTANYETVFYGLLTMFLFLIPGFIEVEFKVGIPSTLEIIVFLFIFSAEILGELNHFYYQFANFDTWLHTINGFLAGAIGFSMIDLLNHKGTEFKLSPIYTALAAFCFSMTIGVLWEFFEFSIDQLLNMNMQKDTIITSLLLSSSNGTHMTISPITSVIVNGQEIGGYIDIGLIDTMKDLFVNFLGAVVFSIFGYYYTKHQGIAWIKKLLLYRKKK